MNILDIIHEKKNKRELSKEQIEYFVKVAVTKEAKDYQLSALLMAILLNGMTPRETADLTMAMAQSGDMLHPKIPGIIVDKHSTGGVGDTTTLVLGPLVAACGGTVLKMSGRGLGHTGGTVDKMESIKGMRTTLPEEEFIRIASEVGCAVIGQSEQLAPADKALYALRDVTGTVDSIPLISSSILSKKFASGAQAIVLDVKYGSGAIMPTLEKSIELATMMVNIGTHAGRNIIAFVTSMDEPLGTHIGNALEVKEAIAILKGEMAGPLKEVALALGASMLVASNVYSTTEDAKCALEEAILSLRGLQKFKEMIKAQGGDEKICDDVDRLPTAPLIKDIYFDGCGNIANIDTAKVGRIAQQMGAGRATKEDVIDPSVGFVLHKRLGEHVNKGELFATVHAKDRESFDKVAKELPSCYSLSETQVQTPPLIYKIITNQ